MYSFCKGLPEVHIRLPMGYTYFRKSREQERATWQRDCMLSGVWGNLLIALVIFGSKKVWQPRRGSKWSGL